MNKSTITIGTLIVLGVGLSSYRAFKEYETQRGPTVFPTYLPSPAYSYYSTTHDGVQVGLTMVEPVLPGKHCQGRNVAILSYEGALMSEGCWTLSDDNSTVKIRWIFAVGQSIDIANAEYDWAAFAPEKEYARSVTERARAYGLSPEQVLKRPLIGH